MLLKKIVLFCAFCVKSFIFANHKTTKSYDTDNRR